MKRRAFISLLGGAAAAWPLLVGARRRSGWAARQATSSGSTIARCRATCAARNRARTNAATAHLQRRSVDRTSLPAHSYIFTPTANYDMKRRDFISLVGGAAAAWPLAAWAQQGERVRRVGVLMSYAADDPAGQTRLLTFAQALAQLGWTEGRNVRIDIRWGAGSPERIRSYAAELVALAPDVILAVASVTTGPLLQATRVVPIVFVQVAEPVGAGFVETLARRTAQRDRA
jgi:hypothetical protein